MEKTTRYYYLKFLAFVLSTIGIIVGFSNKIIAQYGAPMVDYFIKGRVVAEETNAPISNIFVGTSMSQGDSIFSNEMGEFELHGVTDWGREINCRAKDVDGEKNGEFIPEYTQVGNEGDTVEVVFHMKEVQTIDEIIKENNFPSEHEDKKINYKEIIYVPNRKFFVRALPVSKKRMTGNIFVNLDKVIDNYELGTILSFDKKNDSFIKNNNYLIIDSPKNTNKKYSHEVEIYINGFEQKVTLKQTKKEIDAVIIIIIMN